MTIAAWSSRIWRAVAWHGNALRNEVDTAFQVSVAPLRRADVAIFHAFAPPPSGGGNQFLRALRSEFERRGLRVEVNTISGRSRACLLNGFNFDPRRLRRFSRDGRTFVHRIDGPVSVYRGWDDGTDDRILDLNRSFADASVIQSRYSLDEYSRLGLCFKHPTVIPNAVDPQIFFRTKRGGLGRKVRLISTSWSDNPRKGAATLSRLEQELDWKRFELTFVGRAAVPLGRARLLPPVPSRQLADLLREHDVFLAVSYHEPCSNALLEALACGLPALYRQSGSHPELVGEAGVGFASDDEALAGLERLVEEWGDRRAGISIPSLAEVADRYLATLGIHG
jgi:glycosyltransferase involved in cell wall biosynthesis